MSSIDWFSLVVFVLALSAMVFLHEFGHFIAARLFGIEVEEFGFGLPSYRIATLFKWKGTEFTLHALPLGGFVRPKGENDPNVPGGLAAASPWKRLAVLFAGPLMNLLTAVVVFGLITALQGIPTLGPIHIDDVSANSPAQQAGLQANDLIVAVNGQNVDRTSTVSSLIYANLDKPVQLLIERDGKQMTITATPLSSRQPNQGALGITMSPPTRAATIGEVLSDGFMITGLQAAGLVYLPIALVQGAIQPSEARVVGLKGIFDIVNAAVQKDVQTRETEPTASSGAPVSSGSRPTNWTLSVIAMLSVSLGVINLFPIPALDGGRILFTLPEILFHRRVPPEVENMVNGVAMLLLIAFMIYINAMDFINPAPPPIP
ncbi:MAG TPA: M50 family metallopeptidase [Anaerolineales bacterium]|nr:M50 family metallopeptidase [Anaerolineales bacterium]